MQVCIKEIIRWCRLPYFSLESPHPLLDTLNQWTVWKGICHSYNPQAAEEPVVVSRWMDYSWIYRVEYVKLSERYAHKYIIHYIYLLHGFMLLYYITLYYYLFDWIYRVEYDKRSELPITLPLPQPMILLPLSPYS